MTALCVVGDSRDHVVRQSNTKLRQSFRRSGGTSIGGALLCSAMSHDNDEKLSLEDTREAAEAAGLRYVSDEEPGFTRKKSGRGFAYYDTQGKLIREEKILKRLRSLAVPPAYSDVWLCRD